MSANNTRDEVVAASRTRSGSYKKEIESPLSDDSSCQQYFYNLKSSFEDLSERSTKYRTQCGSKVSKLKDIFNSVKKEDKGASSRGAPPEKSPETKRQKTIETVVTRQKDTSPTKTSPLLKAANHVQRFNTTRAMFAKLEEESRLAKENKLTRERSRQMSKGRNLSVTSPIWSPTSSSSASPENRKRSPSQDSLGSASGDHISKSKISDTCSSSDSKLNYTSKADVQIHRSHKGQFLHTKDRSESDPSVKYDLLDSSNSESELNPMQRSYEYERRNSLTTGCPTVHSVLKTQDSTSSEKSDLSNVSGSLLWKRKQMKRDILLDLEMQPNSDQCKVKSLNVDEKLDGSRQLLSDNLDSPDADSSIEDSRTFSTPDSSVSYLHSDNSTACSIEDIHSTDGIITKGFDEEVSQFASGGMLEDILPSKNQWNNYANGNVEEECPASEIFAQCTKSRPSSRSLDTSGDSVDKLNEIHVRPKRSSRSSDVFEDVDKLSEVSSSDVPSSYRNSVIEVTTPPEGASGAAAAVNIGSYIGAISNGSLQTSAEASTSCTKSGMVSPPIPPPRRSIPRSPESSDGTFIPKTGTVNKSSKFSDHSQEHISSPDLLASSVENGRQLMEDKDPLLRRHEKANLYKLNDSHVYVEAMTPEEQDKLLSRR